MYEERLEVLTKSLSSADERRQIGKFIRQIKKLHATTVELVQLVFYMKTKMSSHTNAGAPVLSGVSARRLPLSRISAL